MFREDPSVTNTAATDMSVAALAIICLHYHRPVDLKQLRELVGNHRPVTSHKVISLAAERLGFEVREVRGSNATLSHATLPAMAHVLTPEGRGQFVVVQRVGLKRVTVVDPVHGLQTISRAAFCRLWTGFLLLVTPQRTHLAGAGARKLGPWARLFARWRDFRNLRRTIGLG